jgi:hypothetical protein
MTPHFFGTVWQRTKDMQCFVTIPERKHDGFPLAAAVCIALADEPAVRMRSVVRDRGDGTRYAKIMRRGQAELANRFAKDETVRVELIETSEKERKP